MLPRFYFCLRRHTYSGKLFLSKIGRLTYSGNLFKSKIGRSQTVCPLCLDVQSQTFCATSGCKLLCPLCVVVLLPSCVITPTSSCSHFVLILCDVRLHLFSSSIGQSVPHFAPLQCCPRTFVHLPLGILRYDNQSRALHSLHFAHAHSCSFATRHSCVSPI